MEEKSMEYVQLEQQIQLVSRKLRMFNTSFEVDMDEFAELQRGIRRMDWLADKSGIDNELLAKIKHIHRIGDETFREKTVMMKDKHDTPLEFPADMFPEGLAPSMQPLFLRLLDLVHGLEEVRNKPFLSHKEIGRLQSKLHEIEDEFNKLPTDVGGSAALSELINDLYNEVHKLVEELPEDLPREPEFDKELAPLAAKLGDILEQLRALQSKPTRWITTKDVGHVQVKLIDVDQQYRDAKFLKKGKIPHGQAALAEQLQKAHNIVHELAIAARDRPEVDIDEKLMPMVKKLQKLTHQLEQLKLKEDLTTQDIGSVQIRLSAIDDKYKESHFTIGKEIPRGQAMVTEMLENAHDMVRELYTSLEVE